MRRSRLLLVVCVTFTACHDARRTASLGVTPPPTGLRAAAQTDGDSDALAANLLIAAGTPVQHGGRATFQFGDAALETRVAFHAQAHVEAIALGAGVGGGAAIDGSARIRRLAAATGAPPDANDNGTNLDETAAEEQAALAELAGAAVPAGVYGAMLPWRSAAAELAAAPTARDAWGTLRLRAAPAGLQFDAAQLGSAMLARLHAAARLLDTSRGSRPGADPRSGLIGLTLLQQVVALEETLVASLFGRDGSLPGLRNPRTYAPTDPAGAVWVPARIAVSEQAGLPGAPASYAVLDRASSLRGLAALLEAAAELAWWASERNGNPTLRDVVTGNPFGEPVGRRRPRGFAVPQGIDEVSFSRDIKPMLEASCIACHNDDTLIGGYSMGTGFPQTVANYEKVIAGGNVGRRNNPPNVTSGDHTRSLLWLALAGETTLVPRMPQGCGFPTFPCFSAGQLSLVADWIDQGLRRDPSQLPPPPKLGEDLARALVRNLRVLHEDPTRPGALHDRYEGDARSQVITARNTGAALAALAVAAMALPDDAEPRALLRRVADFAVARLVPAPGGVIGELLGPELTPGLPADAVAHASLAAGLFAAARVLGDVPLLVHARDSLAIWSTLYLNVPEALFRSRVGDNRLRVSAADLAVVLRALQEGAADGAVLGLAAAHEALVRRLLPAVVAAEWGDLGEVLGDGNPDTDGNGIREPALAGGPFGRPPVLLGTLEFGAALEDAAPVSWADTIAPLFRRTCTGCHIDGAARGSYRVDTPAQAATAGESGRVGQLIVPGDPEASLLYRKLVDRRPVVGDQMPLQRPPLDDRGRELVRQWILQGARSR